MSHVTCPNCKTIISLAVEEVDSRGYEAPPLKYEKLISDIDGQISDTPVRGVLAFFRHIGPGRYASGSLYSKYCQWRRQNDAPALKQSGFGRAARLAGAHPVRTATQRDYVIPENIITIEPVMPYINSIRAQKAAFAAAVNAHQGVDGSLERDDQPFELEP